MPEKKKKICFFASELAVLLGVNKFKKPSEILLRLWEYNFPEDLQYFKDRLKENKKKIKEHQTSEQKVNTIESPNEFDWKLVPKIIKSI